MSKRLSHLRVEPEHNFTVKIISYGHANGPLDVPENANRVKMLYSVRDVPNPPNLLRKKYTGMSRRVQKEIFASKEGKARLEQILENVEFKMLEMTEDYSRAPTPEITAQDLYPAKESPRELIVGIMCEEGRHRSVAFVQELGRNVSDLKRPKWVVQSQHRDLGEVGSSEDDTEEDDEQDGSVSPTLTRRTSKTAKQKDKERKKMIGRRINSFVDGE